MLIAEKSKVRDRKLSIDPPVNFQVISMDCAVQLEE